MKTVTEHARKDLLALQDGGVDGILFANEFSLPYQPVADIAVVSAMAYIIGKLKDEISVPFGVNVVKNPIATIDLGAATGAKFGRSCFSGAYMGEYGVYVSNSGEAIRHRKALGIEDMKLLFKVNPEADALSCTKRRSGCCKIHYVRRFCRWIMCVGSGSRSRTGRCDTIQSA